MSAEYGPPLDTLMNMGCECEAHGLSPSSVFLRHLSRSREERRHLTYNDSGGYSAGEFGKGIASVSPLTLLPCYGIP